MTHGAQNAHLAAYQLENVLIQSPKSNNFSSISISDIGFDMSNSSARATNSLEGHSGKSHAKPRPLPLNWCIMQQADSSFSIFMLPPPAASIALHFYMHVLPTTTIVLQLEASFGL